VGRRRGVTDVVVAGDGQPRHGELVQPAASVAEVGLDISTVGADVAGVDDEIGLRCRDVGDHGIPVLVGVRDIRREVAVADL
jgi:hypothetical protein